MAASNSPRSAPAGHSRSRAVRPATCSTRKYRIYGIDFGSQLGLAGNATVTPERSDWALLTISRRRERRRMRDHQIPIRATWQSDQPRGSGRSGRARAAKVGAGCSARGVLIALLVVACRPGVRALVKYPPVRRSVRRLPRPMRGCLRCLTHRVLLGARAYGGGPRRVGGRRRGRWLSRRTNCTHRRLG